MPDPKHQLPRRVYPLRVLGMGLGGVVVGVVLWERHASLAAWLCMGLICFAWPHVAYQLSRRSADPYRAEIRNLLVDSALAAAMVPLMHFNLLPSVLLVTLTMVDKITTGIRGLWARSLPGMVGAAAASAALTGFRWAPETSMPVIIACLPVMALHTLSVSVVSYRLIRKVSRQNQLLDELGRIDALTGLYGRGHWQEQAEATLRRHHATDEPACLVMLDIDHFKQINDQHGHTVGDEVLRALARIVLSNVRATDCAGRYGGDEFAIVLRNMHLDHAMVVAQRIREQVQALQLHDLPSLQFTSSLGVAAADHRHNSLRGWTNAADAELYQAKAAGRNRVSAGAMPALTPVV
jgi:diguanylate cyclase